MIARCCWCQSPFIPYSLHGLDCYVCKQEACQARCKKWAMWGHVNKKKVGWYMPLPRQVEAIEAVISGRYRWILYGGARGGAKSHFLRWFGYMQCLANPDFQTLLLRRVYPQLEKTHMRRAISEAPRFGADAILSAKPPIIRFPNGSVLEFGHCQDMKDVENYLSAEYNLIMPDELGTFEEDMILRIASSARLKHATFKPCIVCTTNPGSAWVRDRWITKEVDRDRYGTYNPADYYFIPSLLDDNPYPDEEYEAFLNAQDPDTRAAWRLGSWDVFEGQYFKEFKLAHHVRRFDIPVDLPRMGGMDWGYAAPGVHLWAVSLPDGHLHVEREFKFRETIAAEVGQKIIQINRDYHIPLTVTYADPSMWIRSSQSGESIAETLQRTGLPLQRSHHERLNGWQRLRGWLRETPQGRPGLTFDPNCVYLLRTLPALTHDKPPNQEDIDTTGDDHGADALRYLVMGRPAPFVATPEPEPGPETAGGMFRALRSRVGSATLGTENVRFR